MRNLKKVKEFRVCSRKIVFSSSLTIHILALFFKIPTSRSELVSERFVYI